MTKPLETLLARLTSLCGQAEEDRRDLGNATYSEKTAIEPGQSILTPAQQANRDTVLTLMTAEKAGPELQMNINKIVAQGGGWSEYVAKKILTAVEQMIREDSPMRAAMTDAYQRSVDAAEKLTTLAKDHPKLCTLIALGVLAILVPVVITWLGFTAEGVVAGSFAARWQSMYGGFVEAGSWFSYFQKLGSRIPHALL